MAEQPMTLDEWKSVQPGTRVVIRGHVYPLLRVYDSLVMGRCERCGSEAFCQSYEAEIAPAPTLAERFARLPEELQKPAFGGAHWPANYDIEPLAWTRDKLYHVRYRGRSGHWEEIGVTSDSLAAAELIAAHAAKREATDGIPHSGD